MFSGLLESLRVFLRSLLDVESPSNLPEARQSLIYRERRIIFPSPVLRTNTFPPLPIFHRLTLFEGEMSSVMVRPWFVIESSALVSTVKLEPAGTVREIDPSPVLALRVLKFPSNEIAPSPVRASTCPSKSVTRT